MESNGQEVDETSIGRIRQYLTVDLLWIEAIAKKYNEWPSLLRALTVGVAAYVVEPDAIMIISHDEHGLRFAGLCEPAGIKSLVRLTRMMTAGARATETELHGHWKKGSWQASLAERNGFVLN